MTTSFRELCIRFNDEDTAIRFLQEKGILHQQRLCTRGHATKLTVEGNGKAPRWKCRKAQCRIEVSLRTGTWFHGQMLDFRTAILLIYSWSNDYCSTKFCSKELGPSANCSVSWKRLLREVATESLLSNRLVIGGPNRTVEVDETLYSKSKSHRGRLYPEQWVFGGVCRETGESFLVPVANRSSQTLIPLIRQYIRPGTTVMTDCWAGYRSLSREDYTHLSVNHSINFVHPMTGAHTQTVESQWAQVKRLNKLRCDTRRSELDSYLCEFMWRRRLRPNEDPFDKILGDIAKY
ncbi:hypothetical protein M513_13549 [Trichuris suis]|uniref:ISXO2-like transposase domain-containing protein n=1 Tax=Trichuris suis TaxID=68888 RepID=A0A085LKS5_9BILA|nr:hypothetical protein M513_13549 [Trichuris suis]